MMSFDFQANEWLELAAIEVGSGMMHRAVFPCDNSHLDTVQSLHNHTTKMCFGATRVSERDGNQTSPGKRNQTIPGSCILTSPGNWNQTISGTRIQSLPGIRKQTHQDIQRRMPF
uniref:Uncharacterized protein n=1 Tax=Spongospora subterranea TaxID=70186 RepID=A0A0H5RDS2_9EUKA|eukprot:CRZ12153.1 hypothetical protein [Spongospora subterranea]